MTRLNRFWPCCECRDDVHKQQLCTAQLDSLVRPHVLSEEEAGWKVAIVMMHIGAYAEAVREEDAAAWPWMTTELAKLYCAKWVLLGPLFGTLAPLPLAA